MNMRPAPAADESGTRGVSHKGPPPSPSRNAPKMTSTKLRTYYLSKKSGICSAPPFPNSQSSNGATKNVNNA